MADLPRIAVILTGGTIESLGRDRLDLAWYIEARQAPRHRELVGSVPELKQIATLSRPRFAGCPATR